MAITEARPETAEEAGRADWTEATRLLCMAAYTDATLAQEVVEELVEERHRAVHVPPGVDAEPVIRHCLAAVHRKTMRDRILAADVVLTVLLFPVTFGGSLMIGFLIAWAAVAYDFWSGTYGIVPKRLSRQAFDPADAPAPGSAELVQRTDELVARQTGNVTVYSGFLPFAGAGFDLGGWSFVVDLRRGRDEAGHRLTPKPLEATDLYEGVERAVRGLGMSNLTIEDRAFVSGTDLRGDPALLPSVAGPPSTSIDDAEMRRLVRTSTRRIRHYMCVRVMDWSGELGLSLFLRFGVANGRLFCERSGFLLTPLKPALQRGDGISPEPELADVLRLARHSLLSTPGLSLRSFSVVMRPLGQHRRHAKLLKRVQRDVFFDYGAARNALDRVRSTDYSRYFQKLDKEMYTKVLERTILDAIVDVLDAHDVDTEELVERRSTIINHGIMVPGGSVKAESIAVGTGARILNRLTGAGTSSGKGSGGGGGDA
jgi:hypothetical protein